MTAKTTRVRYGTLEEFKDYTLAVARGRRKVDPKEPAVLNATDSHPAGHADADAV